MKALAQILMGFVVVIIVVVAVAEFSGHGYLIKAVSASYLRGYNSASIGDAKYFDTREIPAASTPWEWPVHQAYNQAPLSGRLTTMLEETESVAFLIVKNDSIIQEYYWDGYSDNSRSNSFSMAKSIVTMLGQIAIQKGIFTSWQQPVQEILPSITGEYADELQLWHLSAMTSGMLWDEHYKDPFSITAKAYYGDNVEQLVMELPIVDKPGQYYNYQSGSTQLLAIALVKATGKPLATLASEWLWQPLQAKNNALWHVDDEDGMELAYCCFNSNARDFARFGKLMVNQGNWNGTQILDSSFVSLATKGTIEDFYGYSFWIDPNRGTPVFTQRGILGQYIISIPEKDLVVVRLGHHRGDHEANNHTTDFNTIVDEVLKMY